jgi:L-alanine-DL-glutamate epimerase-like enolase superfamily enzyme
VKITRVEAIELRLPEDQVEDKCSSGQDALIIKVHTDEGITGIGEVDSCPRVSKAVVEAPFCHSVTSGLSRLLVGENPLDIRVLWEKQYQSTFYYGRRGPVIHTMGGVDMALWDIAGKYYGKPIYQLLGGAFQKRVRAYASILFGHDGNETAEIGRKWVDRGFTAVKFGWAPMGQSEKVDIDLVDGARRGVGPKNDVLIDAGCCWDTMTAIRRARQFEEFGILWLEEPLQQDNLEGYMRLSTVSRIPIAAGEGDAGRFAWTDLIDRGGIHIAQIDLARNGFTEAMRVADHVEDKSMRVVNHFYTTGVNLAAGLHFLAARKSTFILEYCVEETPLRWNVTKQKMEIDAEGYVHVPEGPGLGIDLDEDTIDRFRVA